MPAIVPLVAAIAGAVASAAAASVIGATVLGSVFLGTLAASLAGAVVSVGVSLIGAALTPQKKPSSTEIQPLSDRKRTLREAAAPRRVIVGRVRVGGVLIFVHARDADGLKSKFLTLVLALAGHSCAGIETIYLNNDPITDPKFAGLVKWEFARGTAEQVVPAWVIAETGGKWSADHRARGVALLYIRLTRNATAFPNGLPEITAIVRGLDQVPDPRDGTRGYSANAARVVQWYLTSPLGLNEDVEAIDMDSAIAAANLCDEPVPLKAGGTERRYRCHGAFTLDEQPGQVLRELLSACAGDAIYAGGRWHIEPAAWRPSNRTITEDDLRGPVVITRNRAFRDLANGVRATYVREAAQWEETDAPPLLDEAARAADGGEPAYRNLELPFTLSGTAAQRIMQITLRRLRAQRGFRLPLKLAHIGLRPGSVATIDLPRGGGPGRLRETARCTGWTLDADGAGITATFEQDDAEIYAWSPETDERPLPPVGMVNPPSSARLLTPTLTLTPPSAPIPASIAASWTAVTGASAYDLEWRGPAGGAFTATVQAGTSATISTGGRAEMRVRARLGDQDVGEYDSAPFPPALARFVAAGAAGGVYVEWSGAAQVQVFRSTGSDFAAASLLGSPSGGSATLSLASGTYNVWARAIGAKGAVGAESGPINVTVDDPASGGAVGPPPDAGPPPGGEGGGGGSEGGGSGGDGDGGGGGNAGGES